MTTRSTPVWLHDVLGERAVVSEVAGILAFAAASTWVLLPHLAAAEGLPGWRWLLAALLVADIAAGCLANFTASTNDFYAARPRNRWLFIAVHVHPMLLAATLGAPLGLASISWLATVAGALVVNGLAGHPRQRFVAAFCLASTWVGLALVRGPSAVLAVEALFVLKVVYAFAVDHGVASHDREGLVRLDHRDRTVCVAMLAAAFRDDPLFVALLGHLEPDARERARTAWLGAVFDMNRIAGGAAYGAFERGHLVGAMLLEPPPGRLATARALIAAIRFVPVLARLGGPASRALNRYFRDTRRAVPRGPHHYLVVVGVAESARGRGIGRRLIEHAVREAAADPHSRGVALDTELEANVVRYRGWGFASGTPWTLRTPQGDVIVTPMHRPVAVTPTP